MNTLDFQRFYYIPERARLLVRRGIKRINLRFACLHVPSPWSIINIQRQQNRAGPSRRLFPDFRVDTRSCEHTYDPIRFINYVHPLLPRRTSFLPVKLLRHSRFVNAQNERARWSDSARRGMLLLLRYVFGPPQWITPTVSTSRLKNRGTLCIKANQVCGPGCCIALQDWVYSYFY